MTGLAAGGEPRIDLHELDHGARVYITPVALVRALGVGCLLCVVLWIGALVKIVGDHGFSPFLLLHVAVAVAALYAGLCLLVNRMQVQLDERRLKFRHGPLPTWHALACALAHVESFQPVAADRKKRRWHVSIAMKAGRRKRLRVNFYRKQHAARLAAVLTEQLTRVRAAAYR